MSSFTATIRRSPKNGAKHFWIIPPGPMVKGVKYITVCGYDMGPWGVAFNEIKDMQKVTCKNCIKVLNKKP